MHLVTGGLGFIGNELVRQLWRETEVVILDNRNRVAPRIEDLARVPVHQCDITRAPEVGRVLEEVRPQVVYHLAAIHFIPECNADPERTLRVNVEGSLALARACARVGVEHLVLASSGAVYADSPEPLDEEAPVAPADIYGWSKLFAENLCRWLAAGQGLRVSICRLFNAYGPRETNAHIIPEIIEQLRGGGDELHLGNTSTRRDYIHVSDMAQALIRLGRRPPRSLRVVNVASGDHASVDELIELIGRLLQRPLRKITDPKRFRPADKQVQVADISTLENITGWRPRWRLRRGLEHLLRFEGLLPEAPDQGA